MDASKLTGISLSWRGTIAALLGLPCAIRSIVGTVGLASCALLTSAISARAQGAATSVSVAPQMVTAGGTVLVTAKGTNPCGAVRINYGDGDAITYALTTLPTSQAHVYQKPGTYTITAEGMGNCGGTPTTTVTVSAPPTPPVSSAVIRAVEITPAPARVQDPVAVIVRGSGNCNYSVEYGDGTSEQVNARLPEDSHHTYGKSGRYVVVVQTDGAVCRKVYRGAASRRCAIATAGATSPMSSSLHQPRAVTDHHCRSRRRSLCIRHLLRRRDDGRSGRYASSKHRACVSARRAICCGGQAATAMHRKVHRDRASARRPAIVVVLAERAADFSCERCPESCHREAAGTNHRGGYGRLQLHGRLRGWQR